MAQEFGAPLDAGGKTAPTERRLDQIVDFLTERRLSSALGKGGLRMRKFRLRCIPIA